LKYSDYFDEETNLLFSTRVGVLNNALFLKLFIPPLYDGSYLAFDETGTPKGVISAEAASILKKAEDTPVSTLIQDPAGNIKEKDIEHVKNLIEAGFLVPANKMGKSYWICPDTADNTRHTGEAAERFIEYFYTYFGSVFLDGSLLIDSHGDFLEEIERYFPVDGGHTCVDLGCGSGHYTAALARRGNHVYAIDVNQTRVNAVGGKDAGAGQITPVLANIEDIPLPDGSCDFGMCIFVLEHVADPFTVIDELIRLLRPGGTMVLAVPSFNIRDTLAFWLYGEQPSLNFEHLRSYGLIPGTHPWCAVISLALEHIQKNNCSIENVEGKNILDGLWEPWFTEFKGHEARIGRAFSQTWPWSALGRQTIIYAKKTIYIHDNTTIIHSSSRVLGQLL
jgi:2-polyprenyl-3-methyl-5-hydroxy-6-metoxy-1,4-benzoquinol methylase